MSDDTETTRTKLVAAAEVGGSERQLDRQVVRAEGDQAILRLGP